MKFLLSLAAAICFGVGLFFLLPRSIATSRAQEFSAADPATNYYHVSGK